MKAQQNVRNILITIVSLFLLCAVVISGQITMPAFAATTTYTSVLDDLQSDSTFNVNEYPANPTDYSLNVIQVAESTEDELFIYVYNPSALVKILPATSINMSTGAEEFDPHLYNLKLISAAGVLRKYKVEDFTVSESTVRHYDIVSIYRAFDKTIDKAPGNDNTISEVVYEVAQAWTAKTENGKTLYEMTETEVVTITDKYVSTLRYSQGLLFGVERKCDSHYIAFSTDMQIDDLVEATVYFTTQGYRYNYASYSLVALGDPEEHYVSITADETVSSGIFGLFANVHLWNRIQTVDEFCAGGKLNEEALNKVKNKQWVLRFVETEYSDVYTTGGGYTQYVKVADTAILELTFCKNGKCYSLGVIDNKQAGNNMPDNPDTGLAPPWEGDKNIAFWEYIWRCIVRLFSGTATLNEQIVAVIALFICLFTLPIVAIVLSIVFPAFGAVMKIILKGLWTCILWLLKGLWGIISAPFRLIALIVQAVRKRKEEELTEGKEHDKGKGNEEQKSKTDSEAGAGSKGKSKRSGEGKGGKTAGTTTVKPRADKGGKK